LDEVIQNLVQSQQQRYQHMQWMMMQVIISIFVYLTDKLTSNILYAAWLLSLWSTAVDSSPLDVG
jgi:hypothetical protein